MPLCFFEEFSPDPLLTRARSLLEKLSYLDDFYNLGQTESWALEKLKEHIPHLCDWAKKFVVPFPQPDLGAMDFKTPAYPRETEQPSICVSALKDIEENIWSPRYGLKGWYFILLLLHFLLLDLLCSLSLCFSLCTSTFLNWNGILSCFTFRTQRQKHLIMFQTCRKYEVLRKRSFVNSWNLQHFMVHST